MTVFLYVWTIRPLALHMLISEQYPIPSDKTVGNLLRQLGRHVFRPAHLHLWFRAEGYEDLITALYFPNDPYLKSFVSCSIILAHADESFADSDAVFGVKSSLIESIKLVEDDAEAKKLGFPKGGPFHLLERDFVLITTEQAEVEKKKSLKNYYASLQK